MITLCYSAKGGSGTTVVAATLTLAATGPCLAIDLDGGLPSVLGLPLDDRPGVGDWLASTAPPDRLDDLVVDIDGTTWVLPDRRSSPRNQGDAPADADRWNDLITWCRRWAAAHDGRVVIDAGLRSLTDAFVGGCDERCLVTRNCYLALDAARRRPRPDVVVLIEEPGRALSHRDAAHTLGTPQVFAVDWDPAVARAVDSGLLATRLPRKLRRQLRAVGVSGTTVEPAA